MTTDTDPTTDPTIPVDPAALALVGADDLLRDLRAIEDGAEAADHPAVLPVVALAYASLRGRIADLGRDAVIVGAVAEADGAELLRRASALGCTLRAASAAARRSQQLPWWRAARAAGDRAAAQLITLREHVALIRSHLRDLVAARAA